MSNENEKSNSDRIEKRKAQNRKAQLKFRAAHHEKVKKNDRERKNKKYAEDISFRSEVKERDRVQRALKKLKEKLDEDDENKLT